MNNRTVTTYGVMGCAVMAVICAIVAGILGFEPLNRPDKGICLPSPDLWQLPPLASWGINLGLILLSVIGLSLINKQFSLIRGTDHVLTSLFVLLCCSNLVISSRLTSAMILLPVTLIAIAYLFNSYKSENATHMLFSIATFLSIGTMLQYAVIALIVAVFLSAIVMKCLRFREICAFILGLVAPYWIALGTGLITFDDFHIPNLSLIYISNTDMTFTLVTVIGCAVLFAIAALLALSNFVILFAGNTRVRCENSVINIFGLIAALCMVADYTNMFAYIGVFNLWVAVQLANLFALHQLHRSRLIFIIILIILLTMTILTALL
ncbi:MAG: hypothetical protein K2I91_02775 [Muribaculaceae bacterium]|nr:hypothetical protein [Muribaculaceae bacterium]